ncbi:MAG TPA: hypothetical protein PKL78_12315 [Anaerolineales bacterium]|nr:hypothetical protein [Anaerolineales bacterium]HNN14338.1 hypothetical protein [Anaerolineales bacterium]HNO30466.1 hypothetical protein [Anaerolineales bacterium]
MLSRSGRYIFLFIMIVLGSIMAVSSNVQAQSVQQGVVYNQPIDPAGLLVQSSWLDPDGSDFDQYIWENFTLQTDQSINTVNWYGGYDPLKFGRGGAVTDFTVAIYPSIAAGSEPAVANPPLVEYQTGGNAGESAIEMVNGIPMYSYTFNLPAPFQAVAGAKYWVYIVASQTGSSPDWGFASGLNGNGHHYQRGSGAGGDIMYRSMPGDIAFSLLGPTVPDAPTSTPTNAPVDMPTVTTAPTVGSVSTDTPAPVVAPTSTTSPAPTPSPQNPPCFSPALALALLFFLFRVSNRSL